MNASFRDDLEYPNLTTCQVRLMGSAATSRPPIQLPRAIREDAANTLAFHGDNDYDDFSLERAVLKRKEERDRDRSLKIATSKEELERATIAKMRNVTGAEEDICIAMLQEHGYDVKESIEAYLESSS